VQACSSQATPDDKKHGQCLELLREIEQFLERASSIFSLASETEKCSRNLLALDTELAALKESGVADGSPSSSQASNSMADSDNTTETLTASESEEVSAAATRSSSRKSSAAQLNRRNELGETRLHQATIQVRFHLAFFD
jgi:hypothetical protein